MIVYFKANLGCGLREYKTLKGAERALLKEVGTYFGLNVVRKATPQDIAWVKGMGGWVPKSVRGNEK